MQHFRLGSFLYCRRNLLAIFFAANKNLREKSLFLVINMACADLMLRAVSLPLYIYFVGADYHFRTASPLYIFFHIVDTFFSQASLISAVLISGERFYAIYWPLKHRTLSMKTYRVVIFMAWTRTTIVSTIFLLLNLLIANTSATYAILAYFLVLLSIVCSCNIGIWRKFQRESIASQQQNRASQNRRLTKTLLFVSLIALLSWLPLIIANYLVYNSEVLDVAWYIYLLAVVLCYSNSLFDPFVYALRIPEIRQALGLSCFKKKAENREISGPLQDH